MSRTASRKSKTSSPDSHTSKIRKPLFWDLETTGLNADWDSILSIGYGFAGEKPTVLTVGKNHYDDSKIIKKFLGVFATAEAEVTHYGTNFDLPFLQARMLKHDLGYLAPIRHVDTFYLAKRYLKISSRRLDRVARFLGSPVNKTRLEPELWLRAQRGDRDALTYIAKHCYFDIKVLAWVYKKLAPLMRTHPFRAPFKGVCVLCGGRKWQKRGWTLPTRSKGPLQRLCCKKCGNWEVDDSCSS